MNISQTLENAILNPDATARQAAEQQLNQLAQDDWVSYLWQMTQVLGDETNRTEVRMLAGLGIKNQLTSKDPAKKAANAEKWVQIDDQMKQRIKEVALNTLLTQDDRVANQAAQVVAAIADIELPLNKWPELMHVIVENTREGKPVNVKRASLLTIGYICETADPSNPAVVAQSNGILIAIAQGAQSTESSIIVRRTAIGALVNSLEFISGNFEREGERNYIMQVVCEATTSEDSELQALAFGALAKIMSLYYQYMGVYMEKALYGLTVQGMQSTDDRVACMAVEFWSTVCEEELEIQLQREELTEPPSDLVSYNFALVAITDVLPTLLNLLTRQNEDTDDDSWSVAMAAGACLQLFAQNTGNYVVRPTLQFVEQNLGGESWRQKEAAVMAFGSILDGPDRNELRTVITQALPPILALIHDTSVPVRETVSWCLGRIADLVVDAIDPQTMLPQLLEAVAVGLQDEPGVATNCCWTLINLEEQLCNDAPEKETSPMSQYYSGLVPMLLQISARDDNTGNVRTSAYEALSSVVLYSSQSDMQYVSQVATETLDRLGQTMQVPQQQQQSNDAKAELQELQSNILSLLTNVVRRIGPDVGNVADQLMETFLQLLQLQTPDSIIEEDIFMAISSVATAVDAQFVKYMTAFLPFLTKALENVTSPVCDAAIGLVVDICHSLGAEFIPYCGGIMANLGNTLSNPNVRRELRPLILSAFGDIASSIGKEFIQYLEVVMGICNVAQNMQLDDDTIENEDYLLSVKQAVLDAYVGIVTGLHDSPESLFPYRQQIAQFLLTTYSEPSLVANESVCRSSIGMIGDIAQMYPDGSWRQFFEQAWVADYIKKVKSNPHFSQLTRDTARWAREQQKLQLR